MDAAVREAMMRADAALKERKPAEASAALRAVLARLIELPDDGGALRALLPVQATFMAWLAGDLALAQQFSAHAAAQAARELEESCGAPDGGRNAFALRAAAHYAVAFVPFVQRQPWAPLEQLQLTRDESNRSIVAMLGNMRPQLDRAGWAAWPYPSDVAQKVKHWSARALVDWGRWLLDNVTCGEDIQAVQSLTETALSLLESQQPDQLTADAYNALGRAWYAYGDYGLTRDKAIPCFTEAIRILDGIGNHDDAAIDSGNVGGLLIGLAEFAEANGQSVQAEDHFREAERLLKASVAVHRGCAIREHLWGALANLGSLYMARKEWTEAETTYGEAWDLVQKADAGGSVPGIQVSANLGSARLKRNEPAKAEAILRQTVEAIKALGSPVEPQLALLAYGSLGNSLRSQAKTDEATDFLAKALDVLQAYSRSFFSERSKGGLIKKFRWLYEAMIDCCATLSATQPHRAAVAFDLLESLKWRSLTEVLRYIPLQFPGMESEPLLAEETNLLSLIFEAAIGRSGGPSRDLDAARILRRLDEIWADWEPRHPEYVAMRKQKTADARETSAWLDDRVPALIAYYLGDDLQTALAFILKKGDAYPIVIRLPASPAQLGDRVRALRPQPDEPFPAPEAFLAASQELHRCVIAPVLPFLPEQAGICIVPFGALHNVPFAALHDGRQYLIEDRGVVIAPTATGLRWWRVHGEKPRPESCLIVAVSARSAVGENLNEFKRLAQREISKLFSKSVFVPSDEATKTRLSRELTGDKAWDVVHIACHGSFTEDGLQSYLEMQPEPGVEDPDWKALEIFTQVRCSATLVVLSACDSGVAQTSTNDEIAGLAQAFLFGGASSVLATLWRVEQGIGVEITRDFYELWARQGHSKIEASMLALRARIRRSGWFGLGQTPISPYLWSAFQLYGDWR